MKKANMNVFLYSSGSAQPSGVTKLVIPAIFSSIRIDPKVMKTELGIVGFYGVGTSDYSGGSC